MQITQYKNRPLLYKVLLYVGIILLFSFPIMSFHGTVYHLFWSFLSVFRYIYILIVPIVFITLFRMQHTWGITFSKPYISRNILYGMAVFAFVIFIACSFAMYSILVVCPIVQKQQYGLILHSFLVFFIWLIAFMWLISALPCNSCDSFSPYTYFGYAFLIVSISNYIECLTCMALPPLEGLTVYTFRPILNYFFTTVTGALLWVLCVHRKALI